MGGLLTCGSRWKNTTAGGKCADRVIVHRCPDTRDKRIKVRLLEDVGAVLHFGRDVRERHGRETPQILVLELVTPVLEAIGGATVDCSEKMLIARTAI